MIFWDAFQHRLFGDFVILAIVREIHLVLLVIPYPLPKASSLNKGAWGWIPASTLVYALYPLIHQLNSGGLRKQDTFLWRGSQSVFEASKVTSSASDWSRACLPLWYCPFLPKTLIRLTEHSAFSYEPNSNWKATAVFEAGLRFSLPRHPFFMWR